MATCPACWAGSGSGAAIMSAAKARTAALRYDAVVLCMLTSPRLFSRHQWSVVAQGYSETEEYARRPLAMPSGCASFSRGLGYPRQGSECIDRARTIDGVSGVSAREPGAGEILPGMRRPSHAIRRCAGVAVLVSRGVHAETSRRENSHREGSARRRTEAGHGPVRRSQGLDGAARRPRSRGSTQDPSGWFGRSAVADANGHRRLIARQSETEPPRTAITRGPPANGTPSLECGRRNAFQWNDEGQKRRDYRRDNERSWRRLACDKIARHGCHLSVEVTMRHQDRAPHFGRRRHSTTHYVERANVSACRRAVSGVPSRACVGGRLRSSARRRSQSPWL